MGHHIYPLYNHKNTSKIFIDRQIPFDYHILKKQFQRLRDIPVEDFGALLSKEIEVDIESEVTYYAVDKLLSQSIQAIAQKRGVTADTLINLWVQEKLQEQKAS